jgi:hypothetical protein
MVDIYLSKKLCVTFYSNIRNLTVVTDFRLSQRLTIEVHFLVVALCGYGQHC